MSANEQDMPCYLCAIPGKDKRCRTSVCANCGYRLVEERDELRAELAIAQSAARVLAYCYDRDVRPPLDALQYGRALPVRLPYLSIKETP